MEGKFNLKLKIRKKKWINQKLMFKRSEEPGIKT